MKQAVIKATNVKKRYTLGSIGHGTLAKDFESFWAKITNRIDPNDVIGAEDNIDKKIFWALKGVDFDIYKGETVAILGTNGAGKSTLLKLLCRITSPTDGEIKIAGKLTSMLEVGTGFHPEMTGRENIYINGAILGMSREDVDKHIEEIIEFSECRDFIDTPVKRYSSGMYIKLGFAVAANLDSDIIIMDEVLAVGDLKFQNKCIKKMRSLAEDDGKTVIYVSHNMSTVRNLCTRAIVLNKGNLVFDGDVEAGIDVYSQSIAKSDGKVNLVSNKRGKGMGLSAALESIEVESCESGFFEGDKININLRWRSNIPLNNVYIKLDIKSIDGVPIGSSYSRNSYTTSEEELINSKFVFDSSILLQGCYFIGVSLVEISGDIIERIDEIAEAVTIKINEKLQDNKLKKNYSGKIMFGELT